MKNLIVKRGFLILTVILCVLLLCVKFTGTGLHTIIGMVFTIFSVKHICKYFPARKNAAKQMRSIYDMLIASLVLMFASGIMAHFLKDYPWIIGIHCMSGVWFLVCVIIHVYQFRRLRKIPQSLQ